jgi:hypothetical protein
MEMTDKIYVLKKKKLMYGPYTFEIIKEKGLRQTDMIWFSGLQDWTPVEKIDALSVFVKSSKTHETRKKTLIEKVFSFLN